MQDSAKTLTEPDKKLLHKFTKRWVALVLICLIAVGGYFCYDYPACLQYQIMSIFDIDVTTYSLLYSIYSFPNMILPFCGGKIIDKLGKGNGLIITLAILTAGQIFITIGSKHEKFSLLVFGRGLFGIGNETMFVT